MRVLNLLTAGNIGGIETLCREIGMCAEYDNIFCFLFQEGIIYQQMLERQLNVVSLAKTQKVSLKKLRSLVAVAKECDIVVVHHNDPYLKLYFIALKSIYPQKKYVSVMHSCYEENKYDGSHARIKKIIFKNSFKISDLFIFVSNAGLKSYLPVIKKNKEHMQVVYNGIGIDKIEKGINHVSVYDGIVRILYMGRLSKVKGIDDLLETIAMLKNKYQVDLNIVGDGPERIFLENKAKSLNLLHNVHFCGQQQDVLPYLQQANIFVYPSTWQEVFGISIVEAMAMGLLCIANSVGGIGEIITDGENGFLTKNIGALYLSNEIERAIEILESGNSETVSRSAKLTAQRFSINNTVKELDRLYKGLLNKN